MTNFKNVPLNSNDYNVVDAGIKDELRTTPIKGYSDDWYGRNKENFVNEMIEEDNYVINTERTKLVLGNTTHYLHSAGGMVIFNENDCGCYSSLHIPYLSPKARYVISKAIRDELI